MRKFLAYFLFTLVLSAGAMAASSDSGSQTPFASIIGNVDFTLLDPTLNFGTLIPGDNSSVIDNRVQINPNNNIDFTMEINLTSDPDNLFYNIYLDLNNDTIPESKLDSVVLYKNLTDAPSNSTVEYNLRALLAVPIGFYPVNSSGTITYTSVPPNP